MIPELINVINYMIERLHGVLRREKVIKSQEAREQEKIEEEKTRQLPEEAKQPEKVEPKAAPVKIDETTYYAGSQAELEAAYYDLCKKELAYDYLCKDPEKCVDCQGRPIEPELYKYKCPGIDPEGFGYKYRELRRYSDIYVCCRREACIEYQRRLYEMGIMRYEYEEKKDPFEEFRQRCASLGGGIMTKESYEVTKRSTTAKEVRVLEEYDGWVCVQFIY